MSATQGISRLSGWEARPEADSISGPGRAAGRCFAPQRLEYGRWGRGGGTRGWGRPGARSSAWRGACDFPRHAACHRKRAAPGVL